MFIEKTTIISRKYMLINSVGSFSVIGEATAAILAKALRREKKLPTTPITPHIAT